MSIAGIVAAVVLIVIALVSVSYPLFQNQFALGEASRRERAQDELKTSYERVVGTIRDLDEDYRTGKMNREDYEPEREVWSAQGVALLQQLEKSGGLSTLRPPVKPALAVENPVEDDEIEDAIAQYVTSLKEKKQTSD